MSLANEYRRQLKWRNWDNLIDLCPIFKGAKILDLGCGPGDVSRMLAARGCQVTGVDANSELLALTNDTISEGCTFLQRDLRSLDLEYQAYDGLWCSFTAAYFTDFDEVFSQWLPFVKKDGWVCITDIDDLLGHEPLPSKFTKLISDFYDEAYVSKRYNFKIGSKLERVVSSAGFDVSSIHIIDDELSFSGPCSSEIFQAWKDRLLRMSGLKKFLGSERDEFNQHFLSALKNEKHFSRCKVVSCLGTARFRE